MDKNLKILISGLSKMNNARQYKSHVHPYYQLNHIVRGKYEYTVDNYSFTADVGDTILIPMNSVHSFSVTNDETGYYFEVKFSSFSKAIMELCNDIGVLIKNDDFSGKLLKEIFDENNNSTPGSQEIMETYLYAILYKLSAKKRREKNIPSKYIDVSSYSEPVRQTIRFLENNYKKHLSLDDIVAQTSLQKSYLCGMFKKQTTVTIYECLMIIRVRKAVELLSYTNLPLADISAETGFVNITHFNRVFSKHVMIPPGQFRKHLMSQNFYWNDATGGANGAIENSPIASATLRGRKIVFPQLNANS